MTTPSGEIECRGVVVTADAWVNDVVGHLGLTVPLEVTLEQVTYFALDRPQDFLDLPVWIWMDDPSFYGFPPYGEPTVKAAQDCGGPLVAPDDRTDDPDPDPAMEALLAQHLKRLLPGVGPAVRRLRCPYALTPDRDFVMAPVPGHENVVVGLGAAHGFKFVPTFGRVLADLVTDGRDRHRRVGVRARPRGTDPARLRAALAGVTCVSWVPWLRRFRHARSRPSKLGRARCSTTNDRVR